VQLREAHALGVLDHHQRRVRHVDADLDDRGRHQQLDALPALKASIASSFFFGGIRPCTRPTRTSGSASASAAAVSSAAW
jgi:hypothetical protein